MLMIPLITADIENGPTFSVVDATFDRGKVGFMADGPAYFNPIQILCSQEDLKKYQMERGNARSIGKGSSG